MKTLEHISFPEVAERACALYSEEEDALLLGVLGQEYLITREGVFLRGQRAPESHTAVVVNYLFAPVKKPVMTPWRAIGTFPGAAPSDFRKKIELPITHYAVEIISRANVFLPMIDAKITQSLIGSDMAITVHALPKVYLHVELSQESQDFPAETWILYSNNADTFLNPPGLLTLAEMFKDRLLSLIRIY
ncbi:MAG TPA: DUF3786 domain-containing protein [Nitrospirota bacterium]|nr:DUF3786 domain-containing protein [Nitrospirota bacterium]